MGASNLSTRILAGIVLVGIAIVLLAGALIRQGYSHAMEQARIETSGLVQALDHHAARVIDATDLVLKVIAKQLRGADLDSGSAVAMYLLLRQRVEEVTQIRSIVVFDAAGRAVHDSAALPARPMNVSGRPLFLEHRAHRTSGPHISEAFVNPMDGRWAVTISRRIEKADGGFDGIVVANLDLDYFQSFYRNVKLGDEGSVGLALDDGALLVREPTAGLGQNAERRRLLAGTFARAPLGSLEIVSPVDGIARVLSFRKLADYPLVVFVTRSKAEALATWRQEAWRTAAAALVLTAAIAVLGLLILRETRRRQEALRKLEGEKSIVDAILRTMPDGLHLVDGDMKLIGWNDRLFEVKGVDRDAILADEDPGKALLRTLAARGDYGPGAVEDLVAAREALARSGEPVQYRRHLSSGRWLECRGTPVSGQGYLMIYRDITSAVMHEADLTGLNARLARQTAELLQTAGALRAMQQQADQARAEAEQASRAKSVFLANMSHELRTPLNAVIGFADIIAGRRFGADATDRYAEYAEDILHSGRHLLGLINNILDLSKVEAGRMELHEEAIDLLDCLEDTVVMVQGAADRKSLQLRFQPSGQPLRLRADEQKLRQIFLNILSNAVKFTPAGGNVGIDVERSGHEIVVVFRDTGVGMTPDEQQKVFEPFGRVDSMITRHVEGTGLGMPLAKRLAELHGGSLSLESTPGSGTAVSVHLPLRRFELTPVRVAG